MTMLPPPPSAPLDDDATLNARVVAAVEAQMLMGHATPTVCTTADRTRIVDFCWDESVVRVALFVPLDDLWHERVMLLEMEGLATFCVFVAPLQSDEHGTVLGEIPGWRDAPREDWGTVDISGAGVLRLAALYGRPYVTHQESPAVLAHWTLVQAETHARLRTLAWHDAARWHREYPERSWQRAGQALVAAEQDLPWCPLCLQWRDDPPNAQEEQP